MSDNRIKPGDLCIVVGGEEENIGAMLTVIERGVCTCGAADWSVKDASRPMLVGWIVPNFVSLVSTCAKEDAGRWHFHEAHLIPVKGADGTLYGKEDQVVEKETVQ